MNLSKGNYIETGLQEVDKAAKIIYLFWCIYTSKKKGQEMLKI